MTKWKMPKLGPYFVFSSFRHWFDAAAPLLYNRWDRPLGEAHMKKKKKKKTVKWDEKWNVTKYGPGHSLSYSDCLRKCTA